MREMHNKQLDDMQDILQYGRTPTENLSREDLEFYYDKYWDMVKKYEGTDINYFKKISKVNSRFSFIYAYAAACLAFKVSDNYTSIFTIPVYALLAIAISGFFVAIFKQLIIEEYVRYSGKENIWIFVYIVSLIAIPVICFYFL